MKYTLNIGSGERTFKEYPVNSGFKCINYDIRHIPSHTDVVGDVRELPWQDECFSYILASDIFEHFPIAEINNVLTEWKRVLIVEGVMEFRLPDLAVICKKYVDGIHDAKHTSWLLYGAQTYSGNFHYCAYDRKWLSEILSKNGFIVMEIKDSGNNFELKARKV